MGLLNPLLLLLAGAAAIPLLLHLLQRHHGPRVVFPALRYLRRAETESARRIRVRQILLMLLRVCAVLLIAFAAARPFMRAAGAAHAPTAAVIVLDNSLSSAAVEDDRRVLDALVDRALELLVLAGADDRFWLLRAGAAHEPALSGDAEATAMRVRETQPTAAAADLGAALQRARALLAAGADGRATEIHLLSDLQATSFATRVTADVTTPPVIVWHPGTEPPPNRAVTRVEVGGGLAPVAGQRTTVAATIAGDGEEAVGVRLLQEGRLVAAATARPGETALLALPPREEGLMTGRVEIDADALNADDSRYFVVRVQPPPAVWVADSPAFVGDALDVLAQAGRIRRGASAAAADVLILPAATGLETAPAAATVVVLAPADAVEIPAANRRLTAAGVPWRFAPPRTGEARFGEGEAGDPLHAALQGVRMQYVAPLVPEAATGADTVLLTLADGTPWAAAGRRRTGGAYVVLASPLTAEASTLPTSAAMLPLLDRVTSTWSQPAADHADAAPGATVLLPAAATAVERPDGSRESVTGGAAYTLGSDAGIYRVLRADEVVSAVAVNAGTAAANLSRLDRRGLEARLPGWRVHAHTDAAAYLRAAFRERVGRELWRPLLFALLAVLLVETLVAATGRARRSEGDVRLTGVEAG
jgi:hypothetical protein